MPGLKKILVVDDDADWREYLLTCLEDLGYEASEAASGEEALAWIQRERPSIVLLDLNMPGMRGEEVVEKLPKSRPPIVFLTSSSAQDAGAALGSGPHYYLPKSANREQLSLMLQSLSD